VSALGHQQGQVDAGLGEVRQGEMAQLVQRLTVFADLERVVLEQVHGAFVGGSSSARSLTDFSTSGYFGAGDTDPSAGASTTSSVCPTTSGTPRRPRLRAPPRYRRAAPSSPRGHPERTQLESSIELAVQTMVPGYFLACSKYGLVPEAWSVTSTTWVIAGTAWVIATSRDAVCPQGVPTGRPATCPAFAGPRPSSDDGIERERRASSG